MDKAVKSKQENAVSRPGTAYESADERAAHGRALRDAVPRPSQAGWKPAEGRRNPVEILIESNEGRISSLIPIRFGRMAA
jgi:hypothetical protein